MENCRCQVSGVAIRGGKLSGRFFTPAVSTCMFLRLTRRSVDDFELFCSFLSLFVATVTGVSGSEGAIFIFGIV